MEEKSLVVVEQPQNVQTESVLFIEQFINDNYRLRRISQRDSHDEGKGRTGTCTRRPRLRAQESQ